MTSDKKPGLRAVHANICAKYSYQMVTAAYKSCITEWSHQFYGRMPGFQGHSGIQCMRKKCFLLPPHHLGEKVKTMQTDNPKDNTTLLITLVILLSETQLYISDCKRVNTCISRTFGFSKNNKCLRYTVSNNLQYMCVCS